MNTIIKQDLYRYIGNDCNNFLKQIRYILYTPGFQYIYLDMFKLQKIYSLKLFGLYC